MSDLSNIRNFQGVGTVDFVPGIDSVQLDSINDPDRNLTLPHAKPSPRLLFVGLPNGGSRPGKAGLFLPLGLAYVTAALKEQGYVYDCVDLHTEQIMRRKPFDFWERIQEFDLSSYDLVAFGGVFLKFEDLQYLSAHIRENYSHIFQIVGGNMATMTPDVMLERTQVDCVCLYEGEETIIDLVQTLEKGDDWREVQSIKYRDEKGLPVNSPSRPKLTADKVPHLPDRENWDFDLIRKAYPVGSPGRYCAVVFASRGCPFTCTFCKPLTGKEIRTREIDSIISEIKYLKEHWNVQYVRFFDEVFIGSKIRIRSLCEAMIEEKLNISWWCQTQVRLGFRPPKLAVDDGALGFWKATRKVLAQTRSQRCCAHKTANILNKPPKHSQAKAKQYIHGIWMAETRENAEKAFDLFIQIYEPKYLKATQYLEKDREELLAFYDFPADHWPHIRTTNPIESTFPTIRLKTKKTRACVSRTTILTMVYKLGLSAEKGRRVYQNKCVNGIYKKLKNNLVAEPVGPVKNGFLFFTSP